MSFNAEPELRSEAMSDRAWIVEVRPLPVILVAALLGAAVYAAVRSDDTSQHTVKATPAPETMQEDPMAQPNARDPNALPANHPPIGSAAPPGMMGGGDEAPAIAWKAPASFATSASTSSMRLATYAIAPAAGDKDPAELTVVRAGGTTDANVERWVRQFDDAGKETKSEKTVAGFKVTIVEVSGSYLGGGMSPTGAPEPKKGWSLLGAIVETPGAPYFFKMTGPTATVKKARPDFVAMIDGITKATP